MLLSTPKKNVQCKVILHFEYHIRAPKHPFFSFACNHSFLFLLQYFSYVMSVLYPECLVRLIMDYHSLPFDLVSPCSASLHGLIDTFHHLFQAERKMMGLDEELDLDSDE